MSRQKRIRALALAFGVLLSGTPSALAQQKEKGKRADQQQEVPDRERNVRKEKSNMFKKWIEEDVAYIITPEEKKAWNKLQTDDEREQFIEAFWRRRDPDPDTDVNEYLEEHYERIAYANEHFASGIPGWRTDRGKIYIMFGPADEVESHPSGGSYNRPTEEGGGNTSTYPFEKWRYRYIEGVGQEIILEFVDTTMSGEYRLTMDPSEKDALLYVPNAGLTLLESMGMASKTDRFSNTDGTHLGSSFGGTPASMNEFERLERFAKLQKPPAVKFKDLEAAVNSKIT